MTPVLAGVIGIAAMFLAIAFGMPIGFAMGLVGVLGFGLLISFHAAIIKVGRHLAKVRGVLRDLGLVTRARYVERATMSSQRILALDSVADGEAPYFSMILVHSRAEAWR